MEEEWVDEWRRMPWGNADAELEEGTAVVLVAILGKPDEAEKCCPPPPRVMLPVPDPSRFLSTTYCPIWSICMACRKNGAVGRCPGQRMFGDSMPTALTFSMSAHINLLRRLRRTSSFCQLDL